MPDESFAAAIARMFAETEALSAIHGVHCKVPIAPDLATCTCAEPGPLGVLGAESPTITVRRKTAHVPASLDLLVDVGAMTEDEAQALGWAPPPPPPAPSLRDRLRWRWQAWRERVGRKVGGWLAGVDLSEREEDW